MAVKGKLEDIVRHMKDRPTVIGELIPEYKPIVASTMFKRRMTLTERGILDAVWGQRIQANRSRFIKRPGLLR